MDKEILPESEIISGDKNLSSVKKARILASRFDVILF